MNDSNNQEAENNSTNKYSKKNSQSYSLVLKNSHITLDNPSHISSSVTLTPAISEPVNVNTITSVSRLNMIDYRKMAFQSANRSLPSSENKSDNSTVLYDFVQLNSEYEQNLRSRLDVDGAVD